MTKKTRTYSAVFKAEAVKKIADNNGNISATAKQLGIAMQTDLCCQIRKHQLGRF